MSILDEIDSGLDVDALRDVAKAVNSLLTTQNSVLMITHYQRLIEFIKPAYIHIMVSHLEDFEILIGMKFKLACAFVSHDKVEKMVVNNV